VALKVLMVMFVRHRSGPFTWDSVLTGDSAQSGDSFAMEGFTPMTW
jgi:hypothetical protein